MSADDREVWLGAPQRQPYSENTLDPYTTKIGGKAVYFRMPAGLKEEGDSPASSSTVIPSAFECPKCHNGEHVVLISQLFAPLEPFDRVLYILMCVHCTQPQKPLVVSRGAAAPVSVAPSVCFAVRSENFNQRSFQAMLARREQEVRKNQPAAVAAVEDKGALFEENLDWGDDGAEDWGDDNADDASGGLAPAETVDTHITEADTAAPMSPPLAAQKEYPLAPVGRTIPFKTKPFGEGIPLDLFEEPEDPHKKKKGTSLEEQLEQLEARYGGDVVDATSDEKDDETQEEKFVRKYMARLEWEPSQCVRWCPGGSPLCTSTQTPALATKVPCCSRCGAARRFELQLTAPTVYFLIKEDGGEKKNQFLHFSNIHVFTCSGNCTGEEGYSREHVIVEEEI